MIIKKKMKTTGMTCPSCEKIIAKQVLKLEGVKSIDIDYATETAEIEFDDQKTNYQQIKKVIEEKGYICENFDNNKQKTNWLNWAFAAIGFILIIYFAWQLYGRIEIPAISQNMGYGLLFVVGLLKVFKKQ